jgi:hypothetical protein
MLELCKDCGWTIWRPGMGPFQPETQCLAERCNADPNAPRKFLIACKDRTITKLRAALAFASSLTFGACCVTAAAAHQARVSELGEQVRVLTEKVKRAVEVLNG